MTPTDPNIHINRAFPTVIALTLLLQTVTVVWWAASTDVRVLSLEKKMSEGLQILNSTEVNFEYRIRAIELAAERNGERLTNISGTLTRIERLLETQTITGVP